MTGAAAVPALTITGYAALSRVGDGPAPLPAAAGVPVPRGDAATAALYPQQLPAGHAAAFAGFDVRGYLGRKGTSFYDRATALAVVACGQALRDAAVLVDEDTRGRVGVVLGTTLGSFKSTSDYSRETLVQERPYLVNPVLFPNTVMNCAAGQAAIRLGLRGINATITGGPLAFLNAVRYAVNAIGQGYVDTMLVGAVEEFTPHRAWAAHLLGGGTAAAPAGEGAAVFVVRAAGSTGDNRQSTVDGSGGTGPLAEILAVATGYGPRGRAGEALERCVRRAVRAAGARPEQIALLASGEPAGTTAPPGVDAEPRDPGVAPEGPESGPVARALGRLPERLAVVGALGDCGAATGALALATVLARYGQRPAGTGGELCLLTARGADGGVAAAVVRGWGRAGADRG